MTSSVAPRRWEVVAPLSANAVGRGVGSCVDATHSPFRCVSNRRLLTESDISEANLIQLIQIYLLIVSETSNYSAITLIRNWLKWIEIDSSEIKWNCFFLHSMWFIQWKKSRTFVLESDEWWHSFTIWCKSSQCSWISSTQLVIVEITWASLLSLKKASSSWVCVALSSRRRLGWTPFIECCKCGSWTTVDVDSWLWLSVSG